MHNVCLLSHYKRSLIQAFQYVNHCPDLKSKLCKCHRLGLDLKTIKDPDTALSSETTLGCFSEWHIIGITPSPNCPISSSIFIWTASSGFLDNGMYYMPSWYYHVTSCCGFFEKPFHRNGMISFLKIFLGQVIFKTHNYYRKYILH